MPTSPRASEIGLPTFRASSVASSSAASSIASARRRRSRPRSSGATAFQAGNASLARAIASSASSTPARGISSSTSSVAGSMTCVVSVLTLMRSFSLLTVTQPADRRERDAALPAGARPPLSGGRPRRRRLGRGRGGQPLPRRDERRLDGGDARLRAPRPDRGRTRAGLKVSYVHNECLTSPAQERLAEELVDVAPRGFTRARTSSRAARRRTRQRSASRASYHVERGEPQPLARHLAGAGLPRADDRDARADRPAGPPWPARPLPADVRAHPADHAAASTRPARPRSRRSTGCSTRRARRPSPPSSARRSARAALPAYTPPRPLLGRARGAARASTASWSASTRS